jgi:probable rRNA maturation factor
VRAAWVKAEAGRLLHLLAIDAELSIALVGDAEIQCLNARYRSKDCPTDVLAFPAFLPSPVSDLLPLELLGDVVISLDTASRQAAQRSVGISDEVRVLLVHGVLHLLGHDHERSPAEARRMFIHQRRLVARLGAARKPAPLDSSL